MKEIRRKSIVFLHERTDLNGEKGQVTGRTKCTIVRIGRKKFAEGFFFET